MNKTATLPIIGALLVATLAVTGFTVYQKSHSQKNPEVTFFVSYNNSSSVAHTAPEKSTLESALKENGYTVTDASFVWPERASSLSSGTIITLHSARQFTIEDEEETRTVTTAALTVADVLEKERFTLSEEDFVEPKKESTLSDSELKIKITRVTVSEETEEASIPFQKKEEEDGSLSWQTKKITQKGQMGIRTSRYKVSKHNGVVVAKEKIEERVTKEPIDEKTVIGTKVTVVKKHTGGASWYAHTGTLSAANPWLPFGSYARVTNTANGKSVIVKINDRGPFGGGRIIDLDKVAFAKIADLGTGVINVLMEEIK